MLFPDIQFLTDFDEIDIPILPEGLCIDGFSFRIDETGHSDWSDHHTDKSQTSVSFDAQVDWQNDLTVIQNHRVGDGTGVCKGGFDHSYEYSWQCSGCGGCSSYSESDSDSYDNTSVTLDYDEQVEWIGFGSGNAGTQYVRYNGMGGYVPVSPQLSSGYVISPYSYNVYNYYGYYGYSSPDSQNTAAVNVSEITVGQPGFGNYKQYTESEIASTLNPPPKPEIAAPQQKSSWVDWVQTGLDAAGFLPIIGTAADLINGGVHAIRGNYVEAGFCVIAMVPVVGDGISGARKVAKAADKVGDAVQGAGNLATTTNEVSEGITAAKCPPGSSTCFTAGTQIVVGVIYNEEDCTVIYVTANIESIKTGEVSLKEVTDTFVRTSDHIRYLTTIDEEGDEQVIETTDSHPVWVVTDNPDLSRAAQEVVVENGTTLIHENLAVTERGYYVEAKDLQVGDVFIGANGELTTLTGTERVEYPNGITVYNFTVADNHNYFVVGTLEAYQNGASVVLVHNAGYGDTWTVTSSINQSKGLVRAAEEAGTSVQPSVDRLVGQLQQGNLNPGIGTKHLFNGIFEARAKDGARVYVRNIENGVEIVGKSNKANQDMVIGLLRRLYEK
ncbi:hypothetical protein FACS1894170_04850 [Planctomycetales bacterium]|nr:hypothetical protein FACS1894170_04850 [Planctomycetales bacterium]